MKKWLIITFGIVLLAILTLQLFMFSTVQQQKNPDETYFKMSKQHYKIFVPYIPDSLSFAGETVPVDHIIVRERLEREIVANMYWHSHTILLLKRSGRFFPVIETILKENGVPDDIKYIAMAESELTNAVSPAGAEGFWQFLKGTALEYGLEVNRDVDERYQLEKSTNAACRYLKSSKNQFGSWTMAAASYNMGSGALRKRSNAQKTNDYYSLFLNQETSRYIYRIIALKLICENPYNYGFFMRNKDVYQEIPSKKITVTSTITDLVPFAIEHNLSYLELKYANPWLRSSQLYVAPGKSYEISIPLSFSHNKFLEGITEPHRIFKDTISVE